MQTIRVNGLYVSLQNGSISIQIISNWTERCPLFVHVSQQTTLYLDSRERLYGFAEISDVSTSK